MVGAAAVVVANAAHRASSAPADAGALGLVLVAAPVVVVLAIAIVLVWDLLQDKRGSRKP